MTIATRQERIDEAQNLMEQERKYLKLAHRERSLVKEVSDRGEDASIHLSAARDYDRIAHIYALIADDLLSIRSSDISLTTNNDETRDGEHDE